MLIVVIATNADIPQLIVSLRGLFVEIPIAVVSSWIAFQCYEHERLKAHGHTYRVLYCSTGFRSSILNTKRLPGT
jgi:hypothetical protein